MSANCPVTHVSSGVVLLFLDSQFVNVAMEGGTFPFCGQAFSTFDEFKTELRKLEEKTKHVFTICRSTSVESGNKLLTSDKVPRFKPQWVYKQATVACKQYGTRDSRSTGVRPGQQ